MLEPSKDNVLYETYVIAEDLLELTGVLVLIYALLSHLDRHFGELRLRISFAPSSGREKDSDRPSPS